jgi:hypothetical protein
MNVAFTLKNAGAEQMSTEPRIYGPGQVGRRWSGLLLGVALVAPLALASASAAPPAMMGLSEDARLISDDELGDMRGRYIEAEQVNFFGIQMVSMWQAGDGSVLTASLEFEVNVNNGQFADDATLHANWSGTCSNCDSDLDIPNLTPGTPTQPGDLPTGLASVNGAVQSTEISGDDNDVRNILNIHVGDFDADSVGYDGAGQAELTSATPVRTVELTNGYVVQFSKGANSLGMILQGPGEAKQAQGQSIQSVNDQVANQIAQNVQLIGNVNAIQNTLDVVIGVADMQNNQLAVENALSSMKGWGF